MALTKAEKQVQSLQASRDRDIAKKKAFSLRMSEVVTFVGASVGLGFLESQFPQAASFGPQGMLSISNVTGGGALAYALFSKSAKASTREMAMGYGMAGLSPTLRSIGAGLNLGGLLG